MTGSSASKITLPEFRQLLGMICEYQEGAMINLKNDKISFADLFAARDANYVTAALERGNIPYLDISLAVQYRLELVPFFETLALLHKNNGTALTQDHLDSLSDHIHAVQEGAGHMRNFHAGYGRTVIDRLHKSGLLQADYQLHPLLMRLNTTSLTDIQSMLCDDDLPELSMERSKAGQGLDAILGKRKPDFLEQLLANTEDARKKAEEQERQQRHTQASQMIAQETHRLAFEQHFHAHRIAALSAGFRKQLQMEYCEHLVHEHERTLEYGMER